MPGTLLKCCVTSETEPKKHNSDHNSCNEAQHYKHGGNDKHGNRKELERHDQYRASEDVSVQDRIREPSDLGISMAQIRPKSQ